MSVNISVSLSLSLSLTAVINWYMVKLYNLNLYLSQATKFRIYKTCHTKHPPISMCLGRPCVKNTRQEKYTVKRHVALENKLRIHISSPIIELISGSHATLSRPIVSSGRFIDHVSRINPVSWRSSLEVVELQISNNHLRKRKFTRMCTHKR